MMVMMMLMMMMMMMITIIHDFVDDGDDDDDLGGFRMMIVKMVTNGNIRTLKWMYCIIEIQVWIKREVPPINRYLT